MISPRKDLSWSVELWLGIRRSEVMVFKTESKKIDTMTDNRIKRPEILYLR